jgi:hypothetical protein
MAALNGLLSSWSDVDLHLFVELTKLTLGIQVTSTSGKELMFLMIMPIF